MLRNIQKSDMNYGLKFFEEEILWEDENSKGKPVRKSRICIILTVYPRLILYKVSSIHFTLDVLYYAN